MTFAKHPSVKLRELYKEKNHQGANPKKANILFVGKDPNWATDIEDATFFNLVEEYLNDGIAFWKKYNFHHPFLHSDYNKDGKKYHQAFSRLQLDSSFASEISFVELIGFPTTGMSSSNVTEFNQILLSPENRNHLIALEELLLDTSKTIFLYWGLINQFKFLHDKTGLFKSLANIDKSIMVRTDLNQLGNYYFHKHFSMGISPQTLQKIATVIHNSIKCP
ncbi:hypothetical protein WMW71_10480 [Flavobacterium buctense]|uniref:Uncharacterized protein n=1 Tax=Flavobacterium buctense TaxID=1648146 RepID=A0ABU9E2B0_9FLAO|nr:hypothetical protein [Flavobacterium buctense]